MQRLIDGDFQEADYDPALMAFVHEGYEIRNPFLSECGRFAVDPELAYGFFAHHTGGGCMALVKQLEDGRQIWLTDEGGSAIPEAHEADTALLGVFIEGDQIAYITVSEIPMESDLELGEDLASVKKDQPDDEGPGI